MRIHSGSKLAGLCVVSLAILSLTMGQQGCIPDTSGGDDGGDGTGDGGGSQTGNSGLTGKYAGSTRCELCHSNIHDNWDNTLHSHALETLEGIGQGTNAQCIGCHTVGFGESGGFVDRATTNDLAGVGCEACHGPARDHADNAEDESLRPTVSLSAELCGQCHQGEHHPNFEQWSESPHAHVTEHVAENFESGSSLNSCGQCHSGDFFYRSILQGETVADDALAGLTPEEMTPVACAICHDPHMRTGNASDPEEGRDYQLRFPEVASPLAENTVDAVTDSSRYNLCGQCHHSRGRTWDATSRGPHHSVQSNIYIGEMPVPDGELPLVLGRVSVHSFTTEQCATCHMYRQDFMSEEAPAISGHLFTVNLESCATAGCHPSANQASAAKTTLQTEIQGRLDQIASRLGDPSTWEYTSDGGPDAAGQALLSDEIKQVRFMYHYVSNDGSIGIHNPDYVRDIVEEAEDILTSIGL
jgi:hypothetical protein